MIWSQLKGQDKAVSFLKSAAENNKISHAYLFSGSQSVGKKFAATLFTAAVNCENGGCGVCESCTAILKGLPPLLNIFPVGRRITISQIQEAKHWLELKPGSGVRQFLIIDEIDLMNKEASNALLKTLEEPLGDSCIIGITHRPQNLLPTVRSRFQSVGFSFLSGPSVKEILSQFSGEEELVNIVVRLFPGQADRPLFWLRHQEMFDWRRDVISSVCQLAGHSVNPLSLADKLFVPLKKRTASIEDSFTREAVKISDFMGKKKFANSILKNLELSNKRTKDKEAANFLTELLTVITSFYRDVLMHLSNSYDKELLINFDVANEIDSFSKNSNIDEIILSLKHIEKTNRLLSYNLNEKFILENLFMQLWEVNNIALSGKSSV
jgi:DNA polymerase-3 subunit delta'